MLIITIVITNNYLINMILKNNNHNTESKEFQQREQFNFKSKKMAVVYGIFFFSEAIKVDGRISDIFMTLQ